MGVGARLQQSVSEIGDPRRALPSILYLKMGSAVISPQMRLRRSGETEGGTTKRALTRSSAYVSEALLNGRRRVAMANSVTPSDQQSTSGPMKGRR